MKKRKIDEDNDDNYPQVLTHDGWMKVRSSYERFRVDAPAAVKSEDDDNAAAFVPKACETVERSLLKAHFDDPNHRTVTSSSSSNGFRKFRKNSVRAARQQDIIAGKLMDRVHPKETERDIQVFIFDILQHNL